MHRRIFTPPKNESYFLLGPRGTGKTSFLKDFYKKSLYLDLLLPENYRRFSAQPELLISLVQGEKPKTVIIDEVQKIPELLSVVHSLIESPLKTQFVLSGSSARKLKMKGSDLLASRALLCHFFPFVPQELGTAFDLERALTQGLIPVIFSSSRPTAKLEAYIDLYLKEEIKQEGLVKDLPSFSRFLEAMSFSQASQINISNISRESQVERKSVERYIEVLEDTLLAYRVQLFDKKPKRLLSQHPKFYFFDCGLFYHLRPKGVVDAPDDAKPVLDASFESLVFQYLNAHLSLSRESKSEGEIYFWRTQKGLEVDFVVYGEKHFLAIEVKNTARIKPEHLKGLKAFGQDYPQAKRLLVYRGQERLALEGITVMPAEEFFGKRPF